MGQKMSRAVVVGLGAAVGSVAVAALISAATAPTAHADDFSTIIAAVEAEGADATAAFTTGSADGYGTADGLTQLFYGLDDDLIGVPTILDVGTTDALTGTTVPSNLASDFTPTGTGGFEFDFVAPTSVAQSVTEATPYETDATALTNTIDGLPSTDFSAITFDNAVSTLDQWILPAEIELIADLAYNVF
jgi:hypothetical protein